MATVLLMAASLAVAGPALAVQLCGGLVPTVIGTAGDDALVGTEGADVILGRGGSDSIDGLGGNDVLNS